jgi:hypothetical protein
MAINALFAALHLPESCDETGVESASGGPMVSLRTLALLGGLAVPALPQQFHFSPAMSNSNPLGRAVHSFVRQNAQLPSAPEPAVRPPRRCRLCGSALQLTPRKLIAVAPGTGYVSQTPSGKCSIPLADGLANNPQMREFSMPTVNPRLDIDPRIHVPPPAPPCK